MVLKYIRSKLGASGVALPWESIDAHEGEAPTTWEARSPGGWFLDSPPGEWKMESPPVVQAVDVPEPMIETPEPQEVGIEEDDGDRPISGPDGGGWTLAVLCMGLSLIAGCVIIPQADANRRLVYQREKLRLDLAQVEKQTAVNKEFLSEIESDPQLMERLAQREMRAVLQGQKALDGRSDVDAGQTATASAARMSPFSIVNVPPPPPLMPYKPVGGEFATLCREPQSHGFVLGTGMILVAAGLSLGGRASGDTV
ncbi:MAG TPA: hypothetical protein VHX86_11235 [Tepidisphaeraceae bacterium]|jgi:hypothetical protein|nr:hypothetical protein [Tepidisphaeraceae bacterium]